MANAASQDGHYMGSDWPAGFTTVSIAAAQDALSDVGLSTKVTVPVGGDLRFDEAEVGSVFIDCTAETRFCRGYPKSFDAISDATWIKRKLVLWLDWPVRPGVVSAENGVTLTNAGRARIRLCRDSEQYWKIHQSPLVDLGAPTMYVFTESGLSNAVRVIGRELTMGSVRRRLRGFGEAAGALAIAVLCLLPFLALVLFLGAGVFALGARMGMW